VTASGPLWEVEMAGKISFLVGFGAGYVLGTRSGRQRYEQIASKAQAVWRDPRVQEKAGRAQQLVKAKASDAGAKVGEKVNRTSSEDSWTQAGTNGAATGSSTAHSGSGGNSGTSS